MGGAATEAHPRGFKWVTEAKAKHKARLPAPRRGLHLAGQPAHPLQPRRRRPVQQAVGGKAQAGVVGWRPGQVAGSDVPDFKVDSAPEDGMGPFIVTPEGIARFFARSMMSEGPFPEHYAPFETPISAYGRSETTQALRDTLADARCRIGTGEAAPDSASLLENASARLTARACPRLKQVFNLTGTVLHTNLGRAVLPDETIAAMVDAAAMDVEVYFTTRSVELPPVDVGAFTGRNLDPAWRPLSF